MTTSLPADRPALSVVIVNWNGRTLLARCLAALLPQLTTVDQVIVVDNGSHDDSVAWLRQHHPDVMCLALAENTGFSGGNNAALPLCTHEWLFLLNNDAFVEPGAVAALTACIGSDPRLGAIAATLVFDHAPDLVASNGITLRHDGVALDHDMTKPVAALPATPFAVAGVSGGAALLRRAMIDDVGLFPADFFNYLEDVDLAWRMRLRGWQSLSCPTAVIRHVYSATSGQGSAFKHRLLGRNRWRTLIRCLPDAQWRRHWPVIVRYELSACLVLLLRGQWAGVWGRLTNLGDLATLRVQRAAIQSHKTATSAEIEHWLAPAPWPWEEYRELRRLDTIMAERRTASQRGD